MLHSTMFHKYFTIRCSSESKVLLAALLSVSRQIDTSWRGQTPNDFSSDLYASYASQHLAVLMLRDPDVRVVQALLILSVYEWGVGEYQKSLVHLG